MKDDFSINDALFPIMTFQECHYGYTRIQYIHIYCDLGLYFVFLKIKIAGTC